MMAVPRKILYADDDPDDRELLLDVMHSIDPQVEIVSVENGLDALEYLQKEPPPSVVVLDLNMPYISGEETFDRIRKQDRLSGVKVIIFTSSMKPSDRQYFTEKGVRFYSKPLSIDSLQHIAKEIIATA